MGGRLLGPEDWPLMLALAVLFAAVGALMIARSQEDGEEEARDVERRFGWLVEHADAGYFRLMRIILGVVSILVALSLALEAVRRAISLAGIGGAR